MSSSSTFPYYGKTRDLNRDLSKKKALIYAKDDSRGSRESLKSVINRGSTLQKYAATRLTHVATQQDKMALTEYHFHKTIQCYFQVTIKRPT